MLHVVELRPVAPWMAKVGRSPTRPEWRYFMRPQNVILSLAILATITGTAHANEVSQPSNMATARLADPMLQLAIHQRVVSAKTDMRPAAPAPALSKLQITGIGSSNIGWENIADFQLSTVYDHGGSQLFAEVFELGYGFSRFASMNGGVLPNSSSTSYTVCISGGQYVSPCAAGQTVVGFLLYWNLSGNQNGSFYNQNSGNLGRLYSDRISIL
jgi:Domain of unknown function (DUF4879)